MTRTMWVAIGYLAFLAAATAFLFLRLHEDRRAYLVSPVGPIAREDLPPLSPLPLRLVLVTGGLLFLFDAVYLGFLLPPVLLVLVEGDAGPVGSRGPGFWAYLANIAFDLLVLRAAWSSWRRRRSWYLAGAVLAAAVLALLPFLWPDSLLPRWFRGRYLGTRSIELPLLVAVCVVWAALSGYLVLRPGRGVAGPRVRDEALAARTEPLSAADRVRVRWARGEMTDAERDAVLGGLDDVSPREGRC